MWIVSVPALDEQYRRTPDWLLRLISRLLGVGQPGTHEYLCPAFGCRCAALTPA